jgi:hypothetical protein
MADVPQTFAQWAAYGGLNYLQKKIINTLIENRPLLGMVPIEQWPGTIDYSWILNATAPTITWEAETATHESTQALRKKVTTYLAYGHGDIEVPIHSNSTMAAGQNMEMADALDLIRSMGISMSGKLFTGAYMATSACTIHGTGLAATPGFDACTAISANMTKGIGGITYTHVGTLLKFKAPGSTTYGAGVDISGGDGDFTLYDGDDTTKYVTLTTDITDFTTGAVDLSLPGALEFGLPTNMAGLRQLAVLDSAQIPTIATDGAAITLAQLDELDEMVLGPKSEKIFLTSARTRRVIKGLIAAAGGTRPAEFQDGTIDKNTLAYEGVRIVADSNVSITETQGASGAVCSSVYCLRLNKEVGFHLIAGAHNGPNEGVMSAVADHDGVGGPIQLPVYMRKLGESYTKQQYKWRISAGIATALKRSKSCAIRYGVTS